MRSRVPARKIFSGPLTDRLGGRQLLRSDRAFRARLRVVTRAADSLKTRAFDEEPFDERIPVNEAAKRVNHGSNVIRSHLALSEESSASLATMKLALASCLRVDPVTNERRSNAIVFRLPSHRRAAKSGRDESAKASFGPSPTVSSLRRCSSLLHQSRAKHAAHRSQFFAFVACDDEQSACLSGSGVITPEAR